MNDHELLELAAKAAGYAWDAYGIRGDGNWWDGSDYFEEWNPLTDDGAALRLAVKLGMTIDSNGYCHWGSVTFVTTPWHAEKGFSGTHPETHDDDSYAATRRAIVRAAAEIGGQIK